MDALPLSVHILTYDSAKTLPTALASLPNVRELLIVDGGSTDTTLKIAQSAGARVLLQAQRGPITDFAGARMVALRATTQPWVLILDSDERLSPELREEIAQIVQSSAPPAVYFVPRKYVDADGTVIEYASTYPNERLYFFHRDAVTQWIKPVHERVDVKPGMPIRHLHGASLAPLPSVDEYKRKNLQYLRIEQASSRGKGWWNWFTKRLLHTLRSRCIQLLRLCTIWLVPRHGKRLPVRYEVLRVWYGWKLIVLTCPLAADRLSFPRP